MVWHIETDIVCLIIMVAMYFDLQRRDFTTTHQDKVFRSISLVTIITIIIDIAASLAMDYVNIWWLYQTLMVTYFTTLPAVPLLWYYYVMIIIHPKFSRRTRIIVALCTLPAAFFAIISLSNPLTGVLFTLTHDMGYARGPLFMYSVIILIFYCIATLVAVIVRYKLIVPRSRAWLLISFFFIVGAGVFFQLSFNGLLLINAAYTIVFVITYYYIQNRRSVIDGLTGIYNRSTGEQRVIDYMDLHAAGGSAAFIITDLDNFKTINDTLGHRFGDTVLKAVAAVFREVFPGDAVLARLGGDEFMVLIDNYGTPADLEALLRKVNPLLQQKLASEIPSGTRQITLSMGVTFFPEQGNNFAELYDNADTALYDAKWAGRSRFVFFDLDRVMGGEKRSLEALDGVGLGTEGERMMTESQLKTMLIVDDQPVDHEVLSGIFKDDFIILHAEDCESALRMLRRHGTAISIVLLDLLMPGKDGFDFLCEKNRSIAIKNIPVLVVTSSADPQDKAKALKFGAADILRKPLDPEVATLRVENVLAKYSAGFWYNDQYQQELLNLTNVGLTGGVFCVFNDPPNYTIDYLSRSLIRLLGYESLQEMLDDLDGAWARCLVPEDYERIKEKLQGRFLQGHEYLELEYRLIRKDGSHLWVRDSGKLFTSDDGMEFVVGLCIDIDDMKTREASTQDTSLHSSGFPYCQ